jgi:hypothetical protein
VIPEVPESEPDYERITDEILDVLGDRSMEESEIAAELGKRGVDLGEDTIDEVAFLLEDGLGDQFLPTADGQWAGGRAVMTGRWLTHRVTSEEIASDLICIDADLLPIAQMIHDEADEQLQGGGSLRYAFSKWEETLADRDVPEDLIPLGGAIVLSEGTLKGLGAGPDSLIGLCRRKEAWQLSLIGDDQLAGPGDVIEAARHVFSGEEIDPPVGADQLISTICVNDPELLRDPIAPLTDTFTEGGLLLFGELVAPAGFDLAEWQRMGLVRRIGHEYGLGFEEGEACADLISLVQVLDTIPDESRFAHVENRDLNGSNLVEAAIEMASHGPTNLIDVLAPWLRSERVAEALLAETATGERDHTAGLSLFAVAAVERAPRPVRPSLWWLQGRVMELWGEPLRARSCFEAALAVDRSWVPALIRLANIESDRGQAQAGLRLLEQAGDRADESLVELLRQQLPRVRTDVPRNAKCPCGSGRKFKQCHMRQDLAPLGERAQWLYRKALGFLLDSSGEVLADLARFRSADATSQEGLLEALQDGLVIDVALCEGGIFDVFLEMRGELLPPDERAMADMWALRERSVFEVESVKPGRSLTLRDLRTGDVVEVSERSASQQLRSGTLICTRVLPVADSWQVFGGIEPIGLHERKEILALLDAGPLPEELIGRLSARFASPTMQTMEGEAVVFCNATIEVEHADILSDAFDARYHREDDEDDKTGASRWLELVEVQGADRIRGTITLTGDSLDVSCNSEERFERVLAFVVDVDPGRQIVSETREPFDWSRIKEQEITEESRREHARAQEEALADPEFAAAFAELIANQETTWLDETIPALEGLTPRQAAADPTRRDDLIRLLDSFPEADGNPLAMDPDRLRAALGL